MIWFDKAQRSIVVGCSDCGPSCREVLNTRAEAQIWASSHLDRAHPTPSAERGLAITASRVRRHREI